MGHPLRGTFVGNSIIRLADEGVPIGALSRAFKIPFSSAYGIIRMAHEEGMLTQLPGDDWPTSTLCTTRKSTITFTQADDSPTFLMACKQVFGLTKNQARIMQCLIGSTACTKNFLHSAVSPEAEPKVVDVFICLIRAKLKPFNIQIETIWGQGYKILEADKKKLLNLLNAPTEFNQPDPVLEEATPEGTSLHCLTCGSSRVVDLA